MDAQALYELMCARRSCRAYTEKQVPPELLKQVLEAGRMAPSGKNLQQCHFIVLRNAQMLERLRLVVQQVMAALEPAPGDQMTQRIVAQAKEGKLHFYYGAPTLIIVANHNDNANNFADSATALQNMMLLATALGLGNCWINNLRWYGEEPAIRQFLTEIGLRDNETVCGGLALGYAQAVPPGFLPRTGNTADILE